jgi:hypothetical protein
MTCLQQFANIPVDIFQVIHSYLSHYDYRQFVNSSKSDFEVIKHETVAYGIKYIDFSGPLGVPERHFNLEEAIVSAKKAVKNSQNQVFVRISKNRTHSLPPNFNELTTGLKLLSLVYYRDVTSDQICLFSNVTDLRLEWPKQMTSLDSLQCYKLNSFHVTSNELTDINRLRQFKELHSVYLNKCAELRDVSALRNIKKVSIGGRLGTSDLSELGNHENFYLTPFEGHTANISRLFKLKSTMGDLHLFFDVSQVNLNDYFGHDFDCNSCRVDNSGDFAMKFPSNLGITNLYLDVFEITKSRSNPNSPLRDLQLEGIVSESLDISNFHNLKSCEVYDSASLKSITVNNPGLSKLSINECTSLEEINEVGDLDDFRIINCESLTSVNGIVSVNTMSLGGDYDYGEGMELQFTSLVNFSFLKKVRDSGSVQLVGCPGFTDGNLISHVKTTEIRNCENFQDPSMLGAVNELKIVKCPINSLEGLHNVPILTIKNCPLNKLDGLGSSNKKASIEGVSK